MLNKKVVDVNINDVEYTMTIDIGAIADYKRNFKTSLLSDTQRISADGDIDELIVLQLISSCLKDKKNKSVGLKFLEQFNVLELIAELTPALIEVLNASENMPDASGSTSKKK